MGAVDLMLVTWALVGVLVGAFVAAFVVRWLSARARAAAAHLRHPTSHKRTPVASPPARPAATAVERSTPLPASAGGDAPPDAAVAQPSDARANAPAPAAPVAAVATLPRLAPRAAAPVAPRPDRERERDDPGASLAATADVFREPLARAARAVSLLRLSAPPLGRRPAAALADLEAAIDEAERRAQVLSAAAHPHGAAPVDLAALVEDVVRSLPAPRGVRVTPLLAPARALADERALRGALREVVAAAAAPLAAGDELLVAVRLEAGTPTLALAARGAAGAPLALARALLAPQGVRVEEVAGPRGGWRLRAVLPASPPEARAPPAHAPA